MWVPVDLDEDLVAEIDRIVGQDGRNSFIRNAVLDRMGAIEDHALGSAQHGAQIVKDLLGRGDIDLTTDEIIALMRPV